MNKVFPTTYRIGSLGEFAAWAKDVARDPATAQGVPKKWFDDEATATGAAAPACYDLDNPAERRKRLRALVAGARHNAKRKDKPFDLTPEFVESLWQDGRCAVTGLKFNLQAFPEAFVKHPFAPSIDRKLSSGGYTKDNVRLVCAAANFGMGQWGEEVFLTLARAAVEREARIAGPAPDVERDAKWKAALEERIDAATRIMRYLPPAEQKKQKQHIAGLKSALTKGLKRAQEAGVAAGEQKKSNRRNPAR